MGEYRQSRVFPVQIGGRTVDVTVTYGATYLDAPNGPAITGHTLTITPCEMVGAPELDALRPQITDWIRERYLDARQTSGVTGAKDTMTGDPQTTANSLYDEAKKCRPLISGAGGSVTARLDPVPGLDGELGTGPGNNSGPPGTDRRATNSDWGSLVPALPPQNLPPLDVGPPAGPSHAFGIEPATGAGSIHNWGSFGIPALDLGPPVAPGDLLDWLQASPFGNGADPFARPLPSQTPQPGQTQAGSSLSAPLPQTRTTPR
jgi:hypothetical protein